MRALGMAIFGAPIITAVLASSVPSNAQIAAAQNSATLATDINGFGIGMTLAEARSISPLTHIGGDQFETTADGISYNFGVTPLGRIYRVQSSQNLGAFGVDRNFISTLATRLFEKYGRPVRQNGSLFEWELIQPVTNEFGQRLPFRTMWMTAMVGEDGESRTLEITLIDFRVLWTDQATAIRPVREQAEDRIRF
jgi:hypothetical protein